MNSKIGKYKKAVYSFPLLILMAFSMYLLLTVGMRAAQLLLPGVMGQYNSMIEDSGLAELTLLSTFGTLLLAPVLEELLFRGLITWCLKRIGIRFWIVNVIQAVLFGIYHMNWVQGCYAFLLGLLCGYVCEKYETLVASMFLHGCFNFFGTYLAVALSALPDTDFLYGAMFAAGLLLLILSLRLMQKSLLPARRKEEIK